MSYVHYSRYADENNQKWSVDQFLTQKVLTQAPDSRMTLSFSSANLSVDELRNIMEKIKYRSFTKIDFSNNKFSDDGAIIIAAAMRTMVNKTMEFGMMEFSGCGIRNVGAIALAKGLEFAAQNSKEMVEMAFQNNEIAQQGAVAIATATAKSRATVLDLSNNMLGDGGADAVIDALARHNFGNINQLVLKHNGIGFAGDKALAEKVPQGVKIIHRVEKISWMAKHPILSVVLIILFFPLILILPFISSERDIEGCEYRGHMRQA